jgi:hypothetical protein
MEYKIHFDLKREEIIEPIKNYWKISKERTMLKKYLALGCLMAVSLCCFAEHSFIETLQKELIELSTDDSPYPMANELRQVIIAGYPRAFIMISNDDPDSYYPAYLFLDPKGLIKNNLLPGEGIVAKSTGEIDLPTVYFKYFTITPNSTITSSGYLKNPYVFEIKDIDSISLPHELTLDSDVPGVSIYQNSKLIGRTPLTFRFTGHTDYCFYAWKDEYLPQNLDIKVTERKQSYKIELGSEPARTIIFQPSPTKEADLIINGMNFGKAAESHVIRGKVPPSSTLTLRANGMQKTYDLDFLPSQDQIVPLEFDAEPRCLTIKATPKNARITVNGIVASSNTVTTYQRENAIEVSCDEYVTKSEKLSIDPYGSAHLSYNLAHDWPTARKNINTSGLYLGSMYMTLPSSSNLAKKFPALWGGRIAALLGKTEDIVITELGIDGAYSDNSNVAETESYSLIDAYAGLGLKLWLGKAGFLYTKISGIGGYAFYTCDLNSSSGYLTTSSSLSSGIDTSFPFGEMEASVGARFMLGSTGVSVEYGIRPQMKDSTFSLSTMTFSQVMQLGIKF